MVGAIYLLLWRPQQRRIAAVRRLQSQIQEGDEVLTTSGIYGQITKIDDLKVQLQIADKVRIEVSRASIGGYQGQPPVVEQTNP